MIDCTNALDSDQKQRFRDATDAAIRLVELFGLEHVHSFNVALHEAAKQTGKPEHVLLASLSSVAIMHVVTEIAKRQAAESN